MEDKQKQIEEMAKLIDDRLIEARGYLGSMNKGEGYWIAQKLIERYQPKLPENAVVLTKEEADRFRGQTLNIKKVKVHFANKLKEKISDISCCGTVDEYPITFWNGLINDTLKETGC